MGQNPPPLELLFLKMNILEFLTGQQRYALLLGQILTFFSNDIINTGIEITSYSINQ